MSFIISLLIPLGVMTATTFIITTGLNYLRTTKSPLIAKFWRGFHKLSTKDLELRQLLDEMIFAEPKHRYDLEVLYLRRKEIVLFLKENPTYQDTPQEWLEQIVKHNSSDTTLADKILDLFK